MATEAWIESAMRTPKPAADRSEVSAQHLTAGADIPHTDKTLTAAARYVSRACPDAELILDILGLTPAPPPEPPAPADTKTCSHCHQVLPVTEFHVDRNKTDGRYSHCKPCKRVASREGARRRRASAA